MSTGSSSLERPTQRAATRCAEWLVACLGFGWSRGDLDWLEELWWKYHDFNGSLKSAASMDARLTKADEGKSIGSAPDRDPL